MKRRFFAFFLLLALLLMGLKAEAQGVPPGAVVLAEIEDIINPLTTSYLTRVLDFAQRHHAQAVILRLDTPGGLDTAMREMVQAILEAPLPVIVYVAPDGARATSAGMFIALAGHVVAMAPATHIGAAHPVPLGMQADDVMDAKMTSDAAALIRSIAVLRGRNAEWPERAVRENLSLTAQEALERRVIDHVASSLAELLAALDGRRVRLAGGGEVILHTEGVPVCSVPMTFLEQFVHLITNPDIAYLLLSLGFLLLLTEAAEPGLSAAGIGGVIALVVAFVALGNLPINWAGVALLVIALVFLFIALLTDAGIVVMLMALIPFVLGSLFLFTPFTPLPPSAPALRVNPWLIGTVGLVILGFGLVVLRAILQARRLPPQTGAERLVGRRGRALTDLDPAGDVRVDLETWSAVTVARPIRAGEEVEVVGVEGVHLRVRPVDSQT